MAKTKAALKSRKARAKSSSVRRGAPAGEETTGALPGLSFPVVAVGASAGGLAAFTALLQALPAKSGMAFVLIQHLEPKHESALTTLLSKATNMPVVEVSDGIAVEPSHVYVIPPNKNMTIGEERCGWPRARTLPGCNVRLTISQLLWRRSRAMRPSAWCSPAPDRTARTD